MRLSFFRYLFINRYARVAYRILLPFIAVVFIGCGSYEADSGPSGIAVDPSDNIYVTYTTCSFIKKFNSSGTLTLRWLARVPGWSLDSGPFGVAIRPGGAYVYITDIVNGIVHRYTSSGDYSLQYGAGASFNNPEGIAIDSSYNLYVTDYGNNRVYIFISGGGVSQWTAQGTGDGEFEGPVGIAAYLDTYVYVADYRNNRIQRFDTAGNYQTKWGTKGSGSGEFEGPMGIAVDSSGNVYVADIFNNRVQKFDQDGNYLMQLGTKGGGNGEFERPRGVAVDSAGNIYVADTGNFRVQKFNSAGVYITQWE